ncbi:hypothetical protein ACFX2J_030686 [Malus domestica]
MNILATEHVGLLEGFLEVLEVVDVAVHHLLMNLNKEQMVELAVALSARDCCLTFADISKRILPSIISQQQSTFVIGSNISDNSIIVSEIANHLFKRGRGKNGLISFKMDMRKAYDRIEWMFLRRVMSNWVSLGSGLISSLS